MSESDSDEHLNGEIAAVEPATKGNKSNNVVKAINNSLLETSTPVSLIIQSLVQNLCFHHHRDHADAEKVYHKICEMLYKMTIIDNSYGMSEFEGLRKQFQRAFQQVLTAPPHSDEVQDLSLPWHRSTASNESRYALEFQEIAYIDGGGFGKVFRVRHKLDGNEYAMKQVAIRSDRIDSILKHFAEVRTFASLNHSHIVQYKNAWLELGVAPSLRQLDEESSEELDFEYTQSSLFDTERKYKDKTHRITFHNSLNSTRSEIDSESNPIVGKYEDFRRMSVKYRPRWMTLFIQMTLCHSTLKQWLEERNNNECGLKLAAASAYNKQRYNTIMEILRQLLKGVEYIHSKGIVHHDIKPSNIFLQFLGNGNAPLVQLGDFGLACKSPLHSMICGTKLYAAPEQLDGTCDSKSDIYSVGIVAFELTESFCTDMERIKYITELRNGSIPESTRTHQPQLADIISQLVVKECAKRPNATSLLKMIDATERDCQLAAKDEEILKLKQQLSRLQVQTEFAESQPDEVS